MVVFDLHFIVYSGANCGGQSRYIVSAMTKLVPYVTINNRAVPKSLSGRGIPQVQQLEANAIGVSKGRASRGFTVIRETAQQIGQFDYAGIGLGRYFPIH